MREEERDERLWAREKEGSRGWMCLGERNIKVIIIEELIARSMINLASSKSLDSADGPGQTKRGIRHLHKRVVQVCSERT